MKTYLQKNVYQASCERLDYIFKSFERVYLSFSGGKDSGVMLNLTVDYMRKHNIKKKIGILFIDLEAQYKRTISYIKDELEKNADLFDVYWVCLPINLRNATSVFQPFWTPWDLENRDKWVREYPDYPCITEAQNPFDFFKKHMEFEELIPLFGEWYSNGEKTACLVGIRSDESLNRYRTIVSEKKARLENRGWTTIMSESVVNCYPVYDWTTEDIWIANAKLGYNYNKLYDMMYLAGVPISKQRICQPYGDDQRAGLNLFRVIESETWTKVVNRVSGANFGNIYCGDNIMGYRRVNLPKGHTWKSYTKLLLATLPKESADHYKQKFIKFMKYWHRNGSPIPNDFDDELPEEAIITSKMSTRGNKDKRLLVYSTIPDSLSGSLEAKKLAPTWRRMAICIIKNDHLCKSLSFTQTKEQQEKMKQLLEKYKNL